MGTKNLVICGAGIKTLSHHTKEFEVSVKNADLVIYLVNEPLLEEWLQSQAKKTYSLNKAYFSSDKRALGYQLIAEEVLSQLEHYDNVCLVFYGHPLMLADSVHKVIEQSKLKNIKVQVLPGISALDCLLADLEIKLDGGCFLAEASYFINQQVQLDVAHHVILWQVGMVDVVSPPGDAVVGNVTRLKNALLQYYSKDSVIYLYEASIYPHRKPFIAKLNIADLEKYPLSSITTAYLPPVREGFL